MDTHKNARFPGMRLSLARGDASARKGTPRIE
jgi:hypothetical protein